MEEITITAAFKDCIETILYYKNLKTCPDFFKTYKISIDNSLTKEELIIKIKSCFRYEIEDGYIDLFFKRTKKEQTEYLKRQKTLSIAYIKQLKKWYLSSNENKTEIENYLMKIKQRWLLSKLKEV